MFSGNEGLNKKENLAFAPPLALPSLPDTFLARLVKRGSKEPCPWAGCGVSPLFLFLTRRCRRRVRKKGCSGDTPDPGREASLPAPPKRVGEREGGASGGANAKGVAGARPASVYVLGVRVDRVSQQEALDRIEQIIARWRASGNTLPCQQIVTVNTEFVMEAQCNHEFRIAINEATLTLPDGIGIVWATRYLDQPTEERVTGTDTLAGLAKRCATLGYRLYLLGAAPGVAEEAGVRLQALAPGLEIAGTYAGSPAPAEEEGIIERIREAHAAVLCVAYGAPAQELWIRRNLSRLPVAVAMGVGGAYDFLSGRRPRAPRLMQQLGLEWLYRLYREPWRWRRMLAIPHFMITVALRGRKNHEE